jgi:hypothetical protein
VDFEHKSEESLTWSKLSTEIIDMELLNLNVKWGKALN